AAFPDSDISDEILSRYYLSGGRAAGHAYRLLPMYRRTVTVARDDVTIVANFAEVWLAKEGHDGVVGLNLLTKVQMPTLASLYGAMLAGVDYVLMGAGIPREIPGVLDALALHQIVRLKLDVDGPPGSAPDELIFDPAAHFTGERTPLKRPFFFPIISASSLATTLARKATGRV